MCRGFESLLRYQAGRLFGRLSPTPRGGDGGVAGPGMKHEKAAAPTIS